MSKQGQQQIANEQPLAARMRPRTLDEFVGQEHIVAPGRLLRRAIQADQLSSLIFYGPPGTGKTTLAMVIANTTKSHFETLNAVFSGVKDIRRVTDDAQRRRGELWNRSILFVDEVHRWNKAQQDALLPWVENGTIILIGATTENPYFTVNRALVSRSRIFQFKPLSSDNLRHTVEETLRDRERGYGKLNVQMADEALDHLINVASGDCRVLLNALELAVETTIPSKDGLIVVDLAVAEESIQRRAVLYDKEGDYHFDTISAFIKSLRGSDPDAALYWLAKMVYAGEDPRYLLRRMLIFAGEDVGLADPNALVVTSSAASAFDRVGMPEGCYHLGMAALYLSTAPKSNSVMGFFDALAAVEKEREGDVPNHLKDGSRDKDGFGHGVGYLYPHAYRDHWVNQQYLPDDLQGKVFYNPGRIGFEKGIAGSVQQRREAQLAASIEVETMSGAPPEILTFSPNNRNVDRWLNRTIGGASARLEEQRQRVFNLAQCQRHSVVLDLSADNGLLTWEAIRRAPEGGVFSLISTNQAAAALAAQAGKLPAIRRPTILIGQLSELRKLLSLTGHDDILFDLIVGRNILGRRRDRGSVFKQLAPSLRVGARIVLAEIIPRFTQRLYKLIDRNSMARELAKRWATAEETIYNNPDDPVVNWGDDELKRWGEEAGLKGCTVEVMDQTIHYRITKDHIQRWFSTNPKDGRPSYMQHLAEQLRPDELKTCEASLRSSLLGKTVSWKSRVAFFRGMRA